MLGPITQPSTKQIMDVDGTLAAGAVDDSTVLANNVVTDAKLAADAKVGSLAALKTANKASAVGAINELRQTLLNAGNPFAVLEPPAGFAAAGWTPLTIYQDAGGRASLGGVSLLDFAPNGAGAWYLDPAGNNADDGLTPATARRGINYGVQLSNASAGGGTIWLADGVYAYPDSQLSLAFSRNIAVRAVNPGKAILSFHRSFSWALDGLYANTYKAAHGLGSAQHYMVCDALYKNALGDYQRLTKRTAIADVDANPGSWYDDGTTVYVRLSDSRAPDANLRPFAGDATLAKISSGTPTVLFEGILFEGGATCFTAQAAAGATFPTVYFVNCAFKYAKSDGFSNVGADSFLQGCLGACCLGGDGLHYAERATAIRQARGFEIDCVGRDNGDATTAISNGSTGHNSSIVIRLNGNYYRTFGRPMHDVGGTKSWNINCWSHDSASATNDISIGCGTGASDSTEMWLDNCRTSGSGASLDTVAGVTVHTRTCTFREGAPTGAGTVAEY